MEEINLYIKEVHKWIEVPRSELIIKVYKEHKMEYKDLLEAYNQAYYEKYKRIGEMLEEEAQWIELQKKEKKS